jgi:hypothetical protein
MKYDIIGDIHGHVNDLKGLLKKMGYGLSEKGHYYHPDRQAVFVGDYIDRGRNSKEVVQIVRAIQENGSGIALMGNHEYNALCFHTKGSGGEYLREHSEKNIKQHIDTLNSFGDNGFLNETLEWIKQLPLFWEDDHLRVVHACWDLRQLEVLRQNFGGNTFEMGLLETSTKEGNPLYEAIEIVLKGQELPLPGGITFLDKDKHPRREIRVKWWEDSFGKSYQELAVKLEDVKNLSSSHKVEHVSNTSSYPANEKPVFFGHYWLEDKQPKLQASNVCCVDYSIAKEGILVAYRFDGEKELNEKKFIW